ncbi:hypothetical protein Pmani_036433 [Petrolisthes manimaculis]|uniref:Tetraspanin n=1 Tax=Petrolisthes manimaculis TaxID=1843537 RepID=A0AAE1TMF1_9EUCA|nr:hypothetical protein Pmani_036433 [Petrolisthes manimaculis]
MLGGALLGLALWVYIDGYSMAPVTKDIHSYNYLLFFFMAVGAVMFVMGFLGCCGACQESQCMLATFFALVFVVFVGQIIAGVWLVTHEERFKEAFEDSLTLSIQKDYSRIELKTNAFDVIQTRLKCCGSSGPQDWADSYFNGHNLGVVPLSGSTIEYLVPASCCSEESCTESLKLKSRETFPDGIHKKGCAKQMVHFIQEYNIVVLIVIIAILLIEVLAMIFSMVLCCTVRRIDNVKA